MKISAGILLYRFTPLLEIFIVKPGGPFYQNLDKGVWTFPKGEINPAERLEQAAIREFEEETGFKINSTLNYIGNSKVAKRKLLHLFSALGDVNPDLLNSNLFSLEYPKNSGKIKSFPEIEKGKWSKIQDALPLLNPKLQPLLNMCLEKIS